MTNREQLAFCLNFSEYSNHEIAEILSDFCEECGISAYFERSNIEKWLGLKCDENNNWGELYDDDEERI